MRVEPKKDILFGRIATEGTRLRQSLLEDGHEVGGQVSGAKGRAASGNEALARRLVEHVDRTELRGQADAVARIEPVALTEHRLDLRAGEPAHDEGLGPGRSTTTTSTLRGGFYREVRSPNLPK